MLEVLRQTQAVQLVKEHALQLVPRPRQYSHKPSQTLDRLGRRDQRSQRGQLDLLISQHVQKDPVD